jgi:uncharacterized damage-inducible protein DinB
VTDAAVHAPREAERLADQLQRAVEGPAWHGPALFELLGSVDAAEAVQRQLTGRHSIWEIVAHLIVWHHVPLRRLQGEAVDPIPEEDWPAVPDAGDALWSSTRDALRQSYRALHDAIRSFPDERLGETVPGKPYSLYVMLHGVVQHDLYHAGQIALLKQKP